MNLKKVVFVFALLLISDFTFTGCSSTRSGVFASVSPTDQEVAIASQGQISPFDPIMRQIAEQEGLDWRLLAAIAYQESHFNPDARSHRGARGLMQVMGSVAVDFGVPAEQINDPKTNITLAVKQIRRIENTLRFGTRTKEEDRLRIILACYNAGMGHIMDARRLAVKHGVNHNSWAKLAEFVSLKGTPEWVDDEAVRNGAFDGTETLLYVDKVMNTYASYCKNYI
ncbi:MAG: transglycosylase SLT domain-containing protein [Rikenella sp.]|nr:transglycosylase SLT domain-containing protein [Rikenella sp.]